MIASERGVGRIVAAKQDIWPSAPEKVIGMRPEWAESHADTVSRLIVALDGAARWCDLPESHDALAEALAAQHYIAAPVGIIRHVLAGRFSLDSKGNERRIENYFSFHRDLANYPKPGHALWIYSQMIRWGQAALSATDMKAAASAYRPDLYREALGLKADMPELDVEGALDSDRFMDGHVFDPSAIGPYLEGFASEACHEAMMISSKCKRMPRRHSTSIGIYAHFLVDAYRRKRNVRLAENGNISSFSEACPDFGNLARQLHF